MAHFAKRQQFIRNWLETNESASTVSQEFHEEYHKRFPEYKEDFKMWGASPVPQAMRDLRTMADCGILAVGQINLDTNWMPGFPRWVKTYTLKDHNGNKNIT